MVCSVCSTVNPESAARCMKCDTAFSVSGDQPTAFIDPVSRWSMPAGDSAGTIAAIVPGTVIGGRYEVLDLLGEGGMGAVYRAMDRELDRVVAVKIIKPQYAKRAELLTRFKRELVLARQITHRNVIRIFDLGVADGFRFITMELVEGRELSSMVEERGKLPPAEAVDYVEQICLGLKAAHAEGVIHRDLKPSNVMVDAQGRAVIMDFGIARALDTATLTNAGAMVGTPVYMSPEQAKGEALDERSDLYSLGIIFYELLTGKLPFLADNVMTMLLKRCQEEAQPPIELEPSIPQRLNEIVMKAMARDPEKRYQHAQELIGDLEAFRSPPDVAPAPRFGKLVKVWVGVATVLCLALAGILSYMKLHPAGPAPAQKEVRVLVADFDNTTSETVFDGALEPVITTGLEGASFISAFSRREAHKIADRMRPGASRLNEELARLIARREGIHVVLTGLIARQGEKYRISVNAIDGSSGKIVLTKNSGAVKKDLILKETAKLVPALRRALGDVSPENQLMAAGETFTSSSLDAVHDYGMAQHMQWAGRYQDAIASYLEAAKADPRFGRAYAGVATASYNLGRISEAEKYYKLAMMQIDRMSEREKHRTLGGYFLLIRDHQKAIAEFNTLLRQYPYDTAAPTNLAFAYCLARDMVNAAKLGRRAVELYPETLQHNNLAMFSLYAGDTAAAEREAGIVLQQNPAFAKAFLVKGLAQILDGQPDEAAATYRGLHNAGPQGASMAATAMADLAMYEGRFQDAISLLQASTGAGVQNTGGDPEVAKLLILAEAQAASGAVAAAVRTGQQAVALSGQEAALMIAAQVFARARREEEAQRLAAKLSERLAPEPRAWAKVITAEQMIARGKFREAIETLNEAQKLTDTWIGHLNLGRAYIGAGAFPEAHSELDLCLKRRGEATSVFIVDDLPTIRYLPAVYYYTARAQEGLGSSQAAESYEKFLSIKSKSQADALVTDAKKRLAALRSK